jgi:lauroyl/myristoyl acyltransferase
MTELSLQGTGASAVASKRERHVAPSVPGLARRLYDAEALHRAVPWPVAKAMVTAVAERAWERDAALREHSLLHMRYLLGKSGRAGDLDALARRYALEGYLRIERWWRPQMTTRRPPRNFERLESLRRDGRGVIVNFAHMGDYQGDMSSLCRAGMRLHMAVAPLFFRTTASRRERQIVRTWTMYGGRVFQATGGRDEMRRLLEQGEIVLLASDVTGGTTVSMLGRDVKVASGAPRLALETGAWVVPLTAWHDGNDRFAVLEEPFDPREFTSPEQLLVQMMRRHEDAVRAWPEGLHAPLRRWAPADPADVAAFGWSAEMPLRI